MDAVDAVDASLDALARGAASEQDNVYEKVVDAAIAGATHGEIVADPARGDGFRRAAGGCVSRALSADDSLEALNFRSGRIQGCPN